MKISRDKTKAATIALVLLLTMAVSLVALPTATVQAEYKTKKTYAYIIATPNPVGVGQSVLLIFGITDYLAHVGDGWTGITVTVESPDGKTSTLGTFKTDATGATGTVFVPDKVGTYYLQTHFPEQVYTWTVPPMFDPEFLGPILYKASDSEKFALVVQEEPVPSYPSFPLPTEFWSRPIDAQIREWWTIAGNWPTDPPNLFAPYNQGPETPHILWAKPLIRGGMGSLGGGIAGGDSLGTYGLAEHGFETGDAYEGLFGQRVIIGGVLYFNRYKAPGFGITVSKEEQEVVAVDLRTGEEIWVRSWNNTRMAFGQVFYWDAWNYHAVYAYLWATVGNTWHAYEASTGRWIYSMINVPTAAVMFGPTYSVRGPKGEIIIYTINQTAGWMTKWNSTRVVNPQIPIPGFEMAGGSWSPYGITFNAAAPYAFEWNKTIPKGLPGSVWTPIYNDMVLGDDLPGWAAIGDAPVTFWAINLKPGLEGTLLYNATWQKPLGDIAVSRGAVSPQDRVFVAFAKETRQLYGFNLRTGEQIWGPTEPMDIRAIYGTSMSIAYGKVFVAARFTGTVYCYDVKTGKLLWTYQAKDPYAGSEAWQKEFAGDLWAIKILFITDGKIYLGHSEHSPNNPLPRGAPFICLNATTGEEIFRVNGLLRQTDWGGSAIIGDSIIASMNTYDQRVYAIGRGPSATTVEAPTTAITKGSSVVIRGTVMDISAGTKDPALTARFPNGVPAIADENMSQWMLYVYKQFPRPAKLFGVPVTLDAVDPNGNWISIGTVTSDSSGMFKKIWTPQVEGEYTIIATCMGTKSYWASYAQTGLGVGPAPAAPPTVEIPPYPDYTQMFTGIIAAVVVTICLVIYTLYTVKKQRK